MSTIFGLAKLVAADYAYVNNANQELIYEAAQQYIAMANHDMNVAASAFIDPVPTTNFKERYKLPLTGRMQKTSEETTGKNVAQSGSWDVAYPLHNFHEGIGISDVDAAYMTPAEFQLHIDGVLTRARNAMRFEVLYYLFHKSQVTFTDKRHGALTVECLANGDTNVYPPVEGSESEATEDHYLGSAYLASAISDTNNPYKTLVDDLVHHGTNTTEDIPVVAFIHPDQQTVTEALTNFVPYIPRQIVAGMDTDQIMLPSRPLPGKVIGYIRGQCWVSVWNWIPTGYIAAVNLAAPQPFKKRVDPADTGLGNGGLILLPDERRGVITYNSWRLRFGIGGANRLSAAVMDLSNADSDYDVPAAYA